MFNFILAYVTAIICAIIWDFSNGEVIIAAVVLAAYFEILDSREGGDKR